MCIRDSACPLSIIIPEEIVESQRTIPLEETVLEVFPNPVQHSATIRFHLPAPQEARLMVFDVNGQQIAEQGIDQSQGWNTTELDANPLAEGMYYVILQTKQDRWMKKVMVVKMR